MATGDRESAAPCRRRDDVEDANRTWIGSGLQVLATLRNPAIRKLRLEKAENVTAALSCNSARDRDMLARLGILKD